MNNIGPQRTKSTKRDSDSLQQNGGDSQMLRLKKKTALSTTTTKGTQ